MLGTWHRYRYKNLTYLTISIIFAAFLLRWDPFRQLLIHLGNWGYVGAFIGGILFVSTFTVAIGTVILVFLAETLSPFEIGIIAGFGAVVGDLTIFQFIRNKGLVDEIKHLFEYFGGDRVSHLIQTKYFSWTLPVIGALIIASPLPDEIGVSLMGISKMNMFNFIILSFILNSLGILVIITTALSVRP